MKVDTVLEEKGISLAELARRLGVSRQAVSKWVEVPEKWLSEVRDMPDEPVKGERPEDIWEWSPAKIKAEVCSRMVEEGPSAVAASLGLKIWELDKLIDRVRQVGRDRAMGKPVDKLPVNRV